MILEQPGRKKSCCNLSCREWGGSPSKPGFSSLDIVNKANYSSNPNLGASLSLGSHPPFQGCQSEVFILFRSCLCECLSFPLLSELQASVLECALCFLGKKPKSCPCMSRTILSMCVQLIVLNHCLVRVGAFSALSQKNSSWWFERSPRLLHFPLWAEPPLSR